MSKTLSRVLLEYQHKEEKEILQSTKNLGEEEKRRVLEIYEPFKITNDDLNRKYTNDDLRQLCMRTKLRVQMTAFNCVWDAKVRFEKKGRLQNRSERFINALLVKAVMRRMVIPYSDEDVAIANHIYHCQLKKDNNCRLDRWAHQFRKEQQTPLNSTDSESFLQTQESAAHPFLSLDQTTVTDTQVNSIDSTESNHVPETCLAAVENDAMNNNKTVDVSINNIPLENHDWALHAIEANSESMSIDSHLLQTQSQSQPQSQSLAEYAGNYEYFNSQIPATSTQSQQTSDLEMCYEI